ncbi:hypothetical protein Rsub_12788 [Raphidocelis subcapitata]|uniref:Uncharacterized protein n=1 Tax=Raphidocelis subcapitata TaxID=307507 RepID=A0A2V0PKD7_9CHLO|nr:hypothetical protein Rsub_12788 [Raphidocelis subcapitata]|eukprot:GBG00010.1 hypothetical protein Rsub_12788 [Raphidocelis subcapitata]
MEQRAQPAAAASEAVPAAGPSSRLPGFVSTQNVLLGIGTASLLGMFHFYKRKQTVPFKACWALMWPTLGGGIMLAVQPDEQQMERLVPPEELAKRREANDAIRRLAAGGGRAG